MRFRLKGFKNRKKNKIFKTLVNYLVLLAGTAILAFGLYNIHSQSDITEGGILGLTLFINHWFGISPGTSGFVINIICYLTAFRFLGKDFAKYSLAANFGFAFFYSIYEKFPPVLPSFADQPLVASLLGGLFVGIGVGLVVRIGGASAGDDAIALLMNHLFKLPIAVTFAVSDILVLALSLSYIPAVKIGWSLVTVMVSSGLISFIQNALKKSNTDDHIFFHFSGR